MARASTKPVIGLAGGIGSGKSAVAAEFARQGCLVIDSDELGRAALGQPEVVATLRRWWGDDILDSGGRVDRRRVAARVFGSVDEKRRLEGLLHPLIAEKRRHMISSVEHHAAIKAIVVDSPLLFESHLDRECDSVVFVHAEEPERLHRVSRDRGWQAEELRRREQWQLSLDEKRARSEFVINNSGSISDLGPQVEAILQAIASRRRSAVE